MSRTETLSRTERDARIADDIRIDIADDVDGSPIPFRPLADGWANVGPIACDASCASYDQEEPPF